MTSQPRLTGVILIICLLYSSTLGQHGFIPQDPAPTVPEDFQRTSPRLQSEIESTRQSIQSLQAELDQQQRYLNDLQAAGPNHRIDQYQDNRLLALQNQVVLLTRMMGEIQATLEELETSEPGPETQDQSTRRPAPQEDVYTRRDSLILADLRQRQVDYRRQIDALTVELLEISEKLKDPDRRYALARKLQEREENPPPGKRVSTPAAKPIHIDNISARSIDLAAVDLVRAGHSLDQARMLIIDDLPDDQVLAFYQNLPRAERYRLYDIADEILAQEGKTMTDARRAALFFYFYTP